MEVASPTHATVILVIAKAHHRPADLAELPVDPVRPLLGGIVVEAQDKGADGKVGEGEIAHLPVDGDALGITHAPVVCTLTASLAARIAAQVLEFSVALNRFTCTAQVLFAGAV